VEIVNARESRFWRKYVRVLFHVKQADAGRQQDKQDKTDGIPAICKKTRPSRPMRKAVSTHPAAPATRELQRWKSRVFRRESRVFSRNRAFSTHFARLDFNQE
jgi:hypothetical protein